MRNDKTVILMLLLLTHTLLRGEENSDAQLVAPTDSGREVVIKPNVEKLKERGLTVAAFRALCERRRFSENAPDFEFQGKRMALNLVAEVTVRDLQAPPFTVVLPDGRAVKISPNPKAIAEYGVPGHYFEEEVRRKLADIFLPDPAKATVLSGIPVPGGQVPNAWGLDHVHISIGEPLDKFARVELAGEKGPQAADLQRMREIHTILEATVNREVGVAREAFEKSFGFGKEQAREPDEGHFKSIPGWEFKVGDGRLTVWYDEQRRVRDISAYSGLPHRTDPTDSRADAIAQCTLDFEFLCAFLKAKCTNMDEVAKRKVFEFLKAGRNWTDAEWTKLTDGK